VHAVCVASGLVNAEVVFVPNAVEPYPRPGWPELFEEEPLTETVELKEGLHASM
jgi:hypothetical protein